MNPLYRMLVGTHTHLAASIHTDYPTGQKTGATCYAGFQFNSDGKEYFTDSDGNSAYDVDKGLWLRSGTAGDVWVKVTITGGGSLGAWNSADSGSTRLQLNTSRAWRILRSTTGTDTIECTIELWDASTGGNLIDTASRTCSATYSA